MRRPAVLEMTVEDQLEKCQHEYKSRHSRNTTTSRSYQKIFTLLMRLRCIEVYFRKIYSELTSFGKILTPVLLSHSVVFGRLYKFQKEYWKLFCRYKALRKISLTKLMLLFRVGTWKSTCIVLITETEIYFLNVGRYTGIGVYLLYHTEYSRAHNEVRRYIEQPKQSMSFINHFQRHLVFLS